MTIYIPAPAGYRLASWHFTDGAKVRPLMGWLMQPHGTGDPITLDGVHVRLVRHDEVTYTELVPSETVPSFDLDRWDELAASTFETAVRHHTASLEAAMTTDGHATVGHDHARFEAASRLVTAGRAQWEGRNSDWITPC